MIKFILIGVVILVIIVFLVIKFDKWREDVNSRDIKKLYEDMKGFSDSNNLEKLSDLVFKLNDYLDCDFNECYAQSKIESSNSQEHLTYLKQIIELLHNNNITIEADGMSNTKYMFESIGYYKKTVNEKQYPYLGIKLAKVSNGFGQNIDIGSVQIESVKNLEVNNANIENVTIDDVTQILNSVDDKDARSELINLIEKFEKGETVDNTLNNLKKIKEAFGIANEVVDLIKKFITPL